MTALLLKEIRGFFSSLLGYVVVAVFLVLTGLFLWVFPGNWNILDGGMATLTPFFTWAPWVLVLLIPAVTMRSFADELRSGTLEILMTRPLSDESLVGAKFVGSFVVVLLALLPTLSYVVVVGMLGQPAWNLDLGAVMGSYIGLVLLASSWVAMGVWLSSLTENALVAFLTTLTLGVLLYVGFSALSSFSLFGSFDWWFEQLGMQVHYDALSRGRLDSPDVAYFLLLDVVFLALATWGLQQRHRAQRSNHISLLLRIAIAAASFVLISMMPFFVDLTAEQRHTLTDATTESLSELDDEVFVTCYLTGENPAMWQRLEGAIEEKLRDFADAARGNLRYQFVDIYESEDAATIGQNEQTLYEKGLRFTRITYEAQGAKAYKTVWPAAIVNYRGREVPVQFFRSETPQTTEAMIQGSINAIEFELATAIRRAQRLERPKIAFIEGHGELGEADVVDWTSALEQDYDVFRVRLDEQLNRLSEKLEGMRYRVNRYDLAIVAKPDSAFSDKDQVILDQFLINGGKILWLVDPILTDLDSLAKNSLTMGVTNPLEIYDLLFDYGVKLNRNLVLDVQCAPIMFDVGPQGNQRQYEMFSWYYAPIAMPQGIGHPITTNLDPIHFDFVSRLDTTSNQPEVKKTILLTSSELSRSFAAPVRVSSAVVDLKPSFFEDAPEPNQPLAILLEGRFSSSFAHRLPDVLRNDPDFAFREKSDPTAMLVIGDGDIGRNKVRVGPNGPQVLPLGYDRYAQRVVYDNKEFLMNAVSYLLDDKATISVRSRSITLRPLDASALRQSRLGWQTLALGLPLAIVGLMGMVLTWLRRRHYKAKL